MGPERRALRERLLGAATKCAVRARTARAGRVTGHVRDTRISPAGWTARGTGRAWRDGAPNGASRTGRRRYARRRPVCDRDAAPVDHRRGWRTPATQEPGRQDLAGVQW